MLPNPRWFIPAVILFTLLFYSVVLCHGACLTASWYSVESCRREGTSGVMANGRKLDDSKFTAASWDYKFNTKLKVKNIRNGKWVMVRVTDRGPAKRLYRQGRVIDLSRAAFHAIESLKKGIVEVEISVVE